ncbi:hypothetical protein KC356_g181 [Hortaea werneckii]|nr:hypothetical protein KC356_g181 [Hortaea werneckii]
MVDDVLGSVRAKRVVNGDTIQTLRDTSKSHRRSPLELPGRHQSLPSSCGLARMSARHMDRTSASRGHTACDQGISCAVSSLQTARRSLARAGKPVSWRRTRRQLGRLVQRQVSISSSKHLAMLRTRA